ncbi:MAG: 3-deoxy-D-manno-octulosonic acid kinase [Halofilum sp. (in: g-proteobacteria)]
MPLCAHPAPISPEVEQVGPDWLIWTDEHWRPLPEWFAPEWHAAEGRIDGEASGRGTTIYSVLLSTPVVLRHYRRGGAVRHLMADRYVWRGLRATRAWREIVLQARLHRAGLPVPAPIAARIRRPTSTSAFYRADLLSARLPNTRTLAQALASAPLDTATWGAVGATIARFHRTGVDHADLNAHNILLDEHAGVYLIDFDRGRLRARSGAWRERNVRRLRRSLEKLAHQDRTNHFTEEGWTALREAWSQGLDA